MADSIETVRGAPSAGVRENWIYYLIVLAIAGTIYLGCVVSPPSQMDDVDSVQAQISRHMLTSGDWVTPRLDGVAYLEKAPLHYWIIAIFYKFLGVHDWSGRIAYALTCMALAALTMAFGVWAFGRKAGFYAGLCVATCVGLFLFTRILIPDVMLTVTVALAMWGFLRALDPEEKNPRLWAALLAASIGAGLLLKSLVGIVFPVMAALIYLGLTRQLFSRETWKRLHPLSGTLIVLMIAVPWHVLATLRNPPYFYFSFHSGPGEYHGFLWFFFMNEQVLRFLNLRYPRDYNTVPRLYFWLFHILWLFPWSVYFPAITKLSFKPADRASQTRLLALCWLGFMLVFFTFSTTQEYYSMPCYPAFALLLGSAMASDEKWLRRGTRVLCAVAACEAIAAIAILVLVRQVPTPADISVALGYHPEAYTLSLGHMEDLTLQSFAYLRLPLAVAAIAFLIGAAGTLRWQGERAYLATAMMMVLFFHAARLALVDFDPFLTSRPLAEALLKAPEGKLISGHPYYEYSSVWFYTDREPLILNGRYNNLEYGSYAPGAPDVFIDDSRVQALWKDPTRYYLIADTGQVAGFTQLLGADQVTLVTESGGKAVLTNHPLPGKTVATAP
ncbi:MAG: glycosyltransferase family 39 protein [Acidobacteriota bacterium]|nr:glycosyltransferase family 39 protein [Acidobacteriota bacterium]